MHLSVGHETKGMEPVPKLFYPRLEEKKKRTRSALAKKISCPPLPHNTL